MQQQRKKIKTSSTTPSHATCGVVALENRNLWGIILNTHEIFKIIIQFKFFHY